MRGLGRKARRKSVKRRERARRTVVEIKARRGRVGVRDVNVKKIAVDAIKAPCRRMARREGGEEERGREKKERRKLKKMIEERARQAQLMHDQRSVCGITPFREDPLGAPRSFRWKAGFFVISMLLGILPVDCAQRNIILLPR